MLDMANAKDAQTFRKAKTAFLAARKVEVQYAVTLRKIAQHIDDIIHGFARDTPYVASRIREALVRYADVLEPWSRAVAKRMVAEVARRDEQVWKKISKFMGRNIHQEIQRTPIGAVMQDLMNQQVNLIRSLPLEAAERVHKLTIEGISQSRRANEIADEIFKTGHATRSRATMIARTEVGRTSTMLTEARSKSVGSNGYIWRTAKDADVRPSHRKMEGQYVSWGAPPILDGLRGHAGTLPNCRCWTEPVLPEE